MDVHTEQEIINSHHQYIGSSRQSEATSSGKQSIRLSAAYSAEGSIEESEPPSPTYGPPANFAEVVPGIYRSSFPRMGNFDFLETLGLKTILTLVAEPYPEQNKEFVVQHNINHVQIPIPANKNPSDVIPPHLMAAALELLLDRKHHPLLIHCNKGKHRTGCVVGCWRKMNDVPMGAIINEYRKYAGVKARPLDERFIETFDENAMYTVLDDMILTRAAGRHELITPPNSVKDDNKDDVSPLSRYHRGTSKASDMSMP